MALVTHIFQNMSGSFFFQAFHTYSLLAGVVFLSFIIPMAHLTLQVSLDGTYYPSIVLDLDAHSFVYPFI